VGREGGREGEKEREREDEKCVVVQLGWHNSEWWVMNKTTQENRTSSELLKPPHF
jgi:hypothetical protein